jgi:hypothetical protein
LTTACEKSGLQVTIDQISSPTALQKPNFIFALSVQLVQWDQGHLLQDKDI